MQTETAPTHATTAVAPTPSRRSLAGRALFLGYRIAKETMDLTAALAGLIVAAVPMLMIAAAIKLDSPGPIFYRQARAGKNGRPFTMLKFRSMVVDAEKTGLGFEVAQKDARITRVGGFLRKWSLDELPQFFNLLKRDVSLVGPRAARMDQIEMFTDEENRRMVVRPGLTGWAVINGRNLIPWKERIRLDLWYVDHQSLWLDGKVLVRTVFMVLKQEGVYGADGVTRDYR